MNPSLQECFVYILHIKGFHFLFMKGKNCIGHCLVLFCPYFTTLMLAYFRVESTFSKSIYLPYP